MTSTTTSGKTFAIDPAHTSVEFVVRHMMITKVRGRFAAVTGTINVADGSNTPTSIEATIDVNSIDTREEQRDAHLKSPDFFQAEQFPQITFRSTRVDGAGTSFRIVGDLTIHGTTREVVLDTTFEGSGTDPWGNQRIAYEARGKISRKDFGLSWNQALETGGVLVGDDVTIEINAQAIPKQ